MEESFVLGKIALCTLDKVKKIPNLFPKKQRSDPSGNPHALRSFLVLNSISPNSLEKMGDPAGFWTSLTAPPPLPAHRESMGILCSWTWWSLYSQEQQKGVWAYPLTEHKVKGKGLSSSRQPLGSIRPGLGVCHVEDCEWMSVQNPGKPHRPEALVPITCLVQDPQIHRDSHGSAALQCFVF